MKSFRLKYKYGEWPAGSLVKQEAYQETSLIGYYNKLYGFDHLQVSPDGTFPSYIIPEHWLEEI